MSFIRLNHRESFLTANRALRRAIAAVIDADDLVYRVLRQPGFRPVASIFPGSMTLAGLPLASPIGSESRDTLDDARRLMVQARAELGDAVDRPLRLLTTENPLSVKTAEYLQQRLALIGLRLTIDRQIFKLWLQKGAAGDFDLLMSQWAPDYDDPMTFADLLASWNPNNRGGYNNLEYDELIAQTMRTMDPLQRRDVFLRMQQLALEDVAIIPLWDDAQLYLQHPRLRGVVRTPYAGDPILHYAWLEAEQ